MQVLADERSSQSSDLRLLIDSVPALIHTGLPEGYLDFFNQGWLDYVGRSLDDLLGWRWTEYIHPKDVEGIVQKWRASLANGKRFLHNLVLDMKDVTLVDQSAIRFLAHCEADAVTLENCPSYIRDWIAAEQRRNKTRKP